MFKNLFYPKICPVCDQLGESLCEKCRIQIRTSPDVRTLFIYDGVVRGLIAKLKYHAQFWMLPVLLDFLQPERLPPVDVIVPVPLHEHKLKQRGYNQSVEIARFLARKLNIPTAIHALTRIKDTPSQTGLSREARAKNLAQAFAAHKVEGLAGKSILVVDDVRTTGATLNEASRILKDAGVREVHHFTLAVRD